MKLRQLFASVVLVAAAAPRAAEPEAVPPNLWDQSYSVRAFAGYKDNVIYSHNQEISSPLIGGGVELLFLRMATNSPEVTLFFSGDYTRYLDADRVQKEALGIAQATVKQRVGHWQYSGEAQYFYFDQVYDATELDRELRGIQLQGHAISLAPSVRRDLPNNLWLELIAKASRYEIEAPIDDYWEAGPMLRVGWDYKPYSYVTWSYEYQRRWEDEREQRDRTGAILAGTDLEMTQNEVELAWRHAWDEANRWRSTSRLAVEHNEDNGPGFYDYWRYRAVEQLRYARETWETRLEARLTHYDYDRQTVSATDLDERRRTTLILNLRAEKNLIEALKLFAEYEYERSFSNYTPDRYDANTVFGGVEWTF